MKMKKELKIGLFGIAALVTLVLGINYLKGMKFWRMEDTYYFSFPHVNGLAKSSHVTVEGVPVGLVTDLIYDFEHHGNVIVEVSMDPRMKLPQQTTAVIVTNLMGSSSMEVILGKDAAECHVPGDTIDGSENRGLAEQAGDLLPDVRTMLTQINEVLANVNALLTDPHVRSIMGNVDDVTANLVTTTDRLNGLLGKDVPQMVETYTRVGENANTLITRLNSVDIQRTLDNVDRTLADVDRVVAKINSGEGTLGALVNDRSMYDNLNRTVISADSLVTDLKAHPKRYVHFSIFGRKDK